MLKFYTNDLKETTREEAQRVQVQGFGIGDFLEKCLSLAKEGFEMSMIIGEYPVSISGTYQCVLVKPLPVVLNLKLDTAPSISVSPLNSGAFSVAASDNVLDKGASSIETQTDAKPKEEPVISPNPLAAPRGRPAKAKS